jgi:hypothetical protein
MKDERREWTDWEKGGKGELANLGFIIAVPEVDSQRDQG